MLLIWFAYKLFGRFGEAFISTQQEIARAMGKNAQNMAGMKEVMNNFVSRDTADHREMLLTLQVVGKELKQFGKIVSHCQRMK